MASENFEVHAVINKNLPSGEQQLARAALEKWQEKLQITEHDENLYSWIKPHGYKDNEEFGFIGMFYIQLGNSKAYFSVLKFIDHRNNANSDVLKDD